MEGYVYKPGKVIRIHSLLKNIPRRNLGSFVTLWLVAHICNDILCKMQTIDEWWRSLHYTTINILSLTSRALRLYIGRSPIAKVFTCHHELFYYRPLKFR